MLQYTINNFYYCLNIFSAPLLLTLLKNNVLVYGEKRKKNSPRYRRMKLAKQQYHSKDLVVDHFFICSECRQLFFAGDQVPRSLEIHDAYHTQIANPNFQPQEKGKMHL